MSTMKLLYSMKCWQHHNTYPCYPQSWLVSWQDQDKH
jgi:hypothetical protein